MSRQELLSKTNAIGSYRVWTAFAMVLLTTDDRFKFDYAHGVVMSRLPNYFLINTISGIATVSIQ